MARLFESVRGVISGGLVERCGSGERRLRVVLLGAERRGSNWVETWCGRDGCISRSGGSEEDRGHAGAGNQQGGEHDECGLVAVVEGGGTAHRASRGARAGGCDRGG